MIDTMTVTMQSIPLVDVAASRREVEAEVWAGWADVVERGSFVLGDEVARFERAYAEVLGLVHCVGVGSGSDALELSLRAAGIGSGDEVIVPVNSFVASALAVVRVGATPVFVDVDPDSLLIDADLVPRLIGPKTKGVMAVHLFGQMAPMEDLGVNLPPGLAVIEDAAQAHGATRHGLPAGTVGLAAPTSFYPGKNLGAWGDAGAVLTNSDAIADRVRMLRNHGETEKYDHPQEGFNSRLDTLQAVVLLAKVRRLDVWNAARREAAARYDRLLDGIQDLRRPTVLPGNDHVWHLYVVRVPRRDHVLRCLRDEGIEAGVHYPVPMHLQGAFRSLAHREGDFPVAEAAAGQLLSLPMFPQITEAQQDRVADRLWKALG